MGGEIKIGESEQKKESTKERKIAGFVVILIIALFGTILIGMNSNPAKAGGVTIISKEPTTQDSKLQAKQIKLRNEAFEDNKKTVEDKYLSDIENKEDTRVEKLLRKLRKGSKPVKDEKDRKNQLYNVLNIKEDEIIEPVKKEVPRKYIRRNKYIPKEEYQRPARKYREDDIFASEIGSENNQNISKYAGLVENDQIGSKLNQLSGMMKKYMGNRDYSQKISRGGEVEVIYNDNPMVTLYESDFLECVLLNKIKSDVAESPAIVEVARDFFDRSNKYVVIPKGTRVIGYSKAVNYKAAAKLYIYFKRMILPNGVSINLQNESLALDKYGINGVSSGVNRHFLLKYGSAFMVGLLDGLGGLAQNSLSQTSPASNLIEELSRNFSQTNHSYLDQYKEVLPTIRVDPGKKILIYMSTDIRISAYSKIEDMSYASEEYYE